MQLKLQTKLELDIKYKWQKKKHQIDKLKSRQTFQLHVYLKCFTYILLQTLRLSYNNHLERQADGRTD